MLYLYYTINNMENNYSKLLKQYLKSGSLWNMEFAEFLAEKLEISESEALKLISKNQKKKIYETTNW